MKKRIDKGGVFLDFIQKIKQNTNGRNVVVWGIEDAAIKCYYVLTYYNIAPLMLMSDKYKQTPIIKGTKVHSREILDKDKVFVVAINHVCANALRSCGFEENKDFILKTDGFLKYDCLWDGVFMGRFTTTGNAFANCLGIHSQHNCIASIGRCCSFNGTAYMNGDHKSTGAAMSQYFQKYVDSLVNPNTVKKLNEYLEPYNKITIGNDVWIGAQVFINASKVKSIGDGAIIGTGAIVNEDVPPYAIVVGVPGKVKKYRFTEEQIEILLRVKWWGWDDETIKENADCFKDINILFEKYKRK